MRIFLICAVLAGGLGTASPTLAFAFRADQAGTESGAADEPAPSADPVPDAELRTFGGGRCLTEPAGSEENAGLFASVILPQLVGAGVDALTAALEAAGRDRVVSRSSVLSLEYALRCAQIARGVALPSRDWRRGRRVTERALENAPFLLEFYFRQSRDGSSLLVTPTRLIYRETLERRQARSPRTLYATLTFTNQSNQNSSTVTVPLGTFTTRSEPYLFDPMMRPWSPREISPLGAANTIWIPNPFRPAAEGSGAPAAVGRPPAEDRAGDEADDFDVEPPPPAASAAATPARAPSRAEQAVPAVYSPGTPIAPLSITVAISETRPGSAVARFLANVLRGSRTGIVNAVDPAQREQARQTEQTAADQRETALITARQEYATAYQAYCYGPAASRVGNAPALYAAQMKLIMALRPFNRPPPFSQVINPDLGVEPYDNFCVPQIPLNSES